MSFGAERTTAQEMEEINTSFNCFSYETHSEKWGLYKLVFDSCPTSELL